VRTGAVGTYAATAVGVRDPVGRHEPSELREELTFERVVAAVALRLGDEAEQPIPIATRKCRHVSKDTSIDISTPVIERATLTCRDEKEER
jgi:hypothetical protein